MKKIIALAASIALVFALQAQSLATIRTTLTHSTDTITNAGVDTLKCTVLNPQTRLTFSVSSTKISGTVAGSSRLYGSLDGHNWKAVGADTLTLSNATTNFHIWILTHADYIYYAIPFGGGSSTQYKIGGYVIGRKEF